MEIIYKMSILALENRFLGVCAFSFSILRELLTCGQIYSTTWTFILGGERTTV